MIEGFQHLDDMVSTNYSSNIKSSLKHLNCTPNKSQAPSSFSDHLPNLLFSKYKEVIAAGYDLFYTKNTTEVSKLICLRDSVLFDY